MRTWSGQAGEVSRRKRRSQDCQGGQEGPLGGEAVRYHLMLTLMTFTSPHPLLPSLSHCLALGQGLELLDSLTAASAILRVQHALGQGGRAEQEGVTCILVRRGTRWTVGGHSSSGDTRSGPQEGTKAGEVPCGVQGRREGSLHAVPW